MTTCSVGCVKQHKIEQACSGERDKVAYVPLSKYNESNMMSDYTYLEDIARTSDSLSRNRREMMMAKQGKSIPRIKFLEKQAKFNHINLLHLPVTMTRHRNNQSNYSPMKKQIFWTIEVHFCAMGKKDRFLEHSVPSSKTLLFFFENMLLAENPLGKGSYGIMRHQLKQFIQAGLDRFVVGLKKENSPQGHFVNVTPLLNASINNVLRGETVIEYPSFYVWLEGEVPENIRLEEKKIDLNTHTTDVKMEDNAQITDVITDNYSAVKTENATELKAENIDYKTEDTVEIKAESTD